MKNAKAFRFKLIPLVITLTAFAFLCKLGFWQLQRAEEKHDWLQAFESHKELDIAQLDSALNSRPENIQSLNGRRLSVSGRLLNQYLWLVDNKTHNGRPGYKVMAPILVPEINGAVMADLGWLAAPKSRDTLPDLELPESLSLSGLIKSDALDAYTLAPDAIGTQWPQRIQSPASALKAEYGFALAPLILYADSETLATLPQTYRPVVMPPEKHRAYAVQWFLLALACLSVFLFASYQRPDKADTQSLEVS